MEYFREVLELASKFHDAKLDEEEVAALLFIILIDAGIYTTTSTLPHHTLKLIQPTNL